MTWPKMKITKQNGVWWILGPFLHTSTPKFGAGTKEKAFGMAAILYKREKEFTNRD